MSSNHLSASELTVTTQIILEKFKVRGTRLIGRTTLKSIDVSTRVNETIDAMIFDISAYVLSNRIVNDTYEFEYKVPATWWDHFKKDKFPLRLLLRWPAKYKVERETVTFVRYATYPMASIIPEKHKDFFLRELGGVEVIRDEIIGQNTQSPGGDE